MKHEILGELKRDERIDADVAQISYQGHSISMNISPDEIDQKQTIALAAKVALQLKQLDAAAKKIAAAELTDTYNGGWNEYDQAQEDGTFKTVSNPELSQAEFAGKLTLTGVNVTGEMLDFFYDDENMFWGHSVVVTAMDGLNFSDVSAEIFG